MTTPNALPAKDDIGTIELTGIPFSTFTRSISLGLHELSIPFIHHKESKPHGPDAKSLNPFGLLPSLVHVSSVYLFDSSSDPASLFPFVHHSFSSTFQPNQSLFQRPQGPFNPSSNVQTLFESNAIRRYIDEGLNHSTSKTHLTPPLTSSSTSDALPSVILRSKIDQYVSIASSTLFEVVEKAVVKPNLAMESNGADEATIQVALEGNLEKLEKVLEILENMCKESSEGKDWIVGEISWADLFLYPALADLKSLPVGKVLNQFEFLSSWLGRMESRPSVKATFEGTLASQRKGKSKA